MTSPAPKSPCCGADVEPVTDSWDRAKWHHLCVMCGKPLPPEPAPPDRVRYLEGLLTEVAAERDAALVRIARLEEALRYIEQRAPATFGSFIRAALERGEGGV